MLRSGSRGREVEYAQQRLNAFGAAPPLAVVAPWPGCLRASSAAQVAVFLVPEMEARISFGRDAQGRADHLTVDSRGQETRALRR